MSQAQTNRLPRPEDVALAFLTPRAPKQRVPLVLKDSKVLRMSTSEGEIAAQRAGTGPTVLLLHGWEGQASDLAAFAPPLLDSGFSVLAMDLPAHGDSAGKQTSIPQSARALGEIGSALGPFCAAIAHSVGSPVLVEALHAGLPVQRVALISAPAEYERHARGFAAAAGLNDEEREAVVGLLREALGVDLREISLPRRAVNMHQPALFIHSSDDRIVSIEDSLKSAKAWPGARHIRVDGLGHRRILTDPAVVTAVIEFITNTH